MAKKSKAYSYIGKKFNKLLVMGVSHRNAHGEYFVFCDCDCGTTGKIVAFSDIKRSTTVSCGCVRRTWNTLNKRVHGLSHMKAYHIWTKIMDRCYNPKARSYKHYGARGISVCTRWHDVVNFIADMGDKPDGLSIDRIDNSKGYSPENCRWATNFEQAQNTRLNRMIEINGECFCLSEWIRRKGISMSTFYYRTKRGLDPIVALTMESRK